MSELFILSVRSVVTFYAVLDSSEHAESGKNCPVKLFDVCLETSGILFGGHFCWLKENRPNLRHASKTTNKR